MADSKKIVNSHVLSDMDSLYEKFKACFMERIKWLPREWKNTTEFEKKVQKAISISNYWFQELPQTKLNNSIVFMMYSICGTPTPDIDDVLDYMVENCDMKQFEGYSATMNNRFYVLDFSSQEGKQAILESITHIQGSIFIPYEWMAGDTNTDIVIEWLPREVAVEEVIQFFEDKLHFIKLDRQCTTTKMGLVAQTGKLVGSVEIKEGYTVNDIPYRINIRMYDGLVTIAKRDPICYGCWKVGHTLHSCEFPYCKQCKKKKPREHLCEGERNENSIAYISQSQYLISLKDTLNPILNEKNTKVDKTGTEVKETKHLKITVDPKILEKKILENTKIHFTRNSTTKSRKNSLQSSSQSMDVTYGTTKRKISRSVDSSDVDEPDFSNVKNVYQTYSSVPLAGGEKKNRTEV